MDTPARGNSAVIWNALKIAIALLLIGSVLSQTDLERLSALLENLSIPWLACYFLLFLSLTLLKAFQYYVIISEGVSYLQVLNVVVLQNAFTNYLASSAGIVSYLTLFRAEHGVKLSRSMAVFLLTKIGDLIVIWLALLVSSFLVWRTIDVFHNLVIVLGAGIGFLILMFLLTLLFRQKFVMLLNKILSGSRLSQISVIQKGTAALETVSEMEPGKLARALWAVFLSSAVYLIASIAWIYVSFLVFDFRQEPEAVIFVSVLIQLVSYLPVQIFGGLGVMETSSLYFWSPFDIPRGELASVLIGNRILFYLLNLFPLIYLPVYSIFIDRKIKRAE